MNSVGCGLTGAPSRSFCRLSVMTSEPPAQTAFDDPAIAVLGPEGHVVHVHRSIGADGVDLLQSLEFGDRNLRDQDRIVAESPWPPSLVRTVPDAERCPDSEMTRRCEWRRFARSAGDRQMRCGPCSGYTSPLASVSVRGIFEVPCSRSAAAGARPLHERKILAVADGEIDFDWIQLRNRSEHRLGADKISNLGGGLSGNAGDQRSNLRKAEIQLGRRHRCLRLT